MSKKYKVGGMSCAVCAGKVESGIRKLDGVIDANVNLATETLTVNFDEDKVSSEEIEEKVHKLGYRVIKDIKTCDLPLFAGLVEFFRFWIAILTQILTRCAWQRSH